MPLGSIFVWVIEGFILSSIPMVLAMVSSSFAPQTSALPAASKPINIADTSVSITLMAGFLLSVVGHLVIANALNRSTLAVAQWAGGKPCVARRTFHDGAITTHTDPPIAGMHSAVSNSLCTAAFLCFMTYLTLYMDTCLFGSSSGSLPAENMCLALFRNTPFPQIVVAVVAVYVMMLFFVSLALAFVSCPQVSCPRVLQNSAWLCMRQLGHTEKKRKSYWAAWRVQLGVFCAQLGFHQNARGREKRGGDV